MDCSRLVRYLPLQVVLVIFQASALDPRSVALHGRRYTCGPTESAYNPSMTTQRSSSRVERNSRRRSNIQRINPVHHRNRHPRVEQ